jgi:phosphoribosylamine--glycine ligase
MTSSLKVLVVGGGGREHALAWKLAQSSLVGQVFCAPGNAGTAAEPGVANAETLPAAAGSPAVRSGVVAAERPFDANAPQAVLALARRLKVDLTVVGPEDPLAAGVADVFAEAGLFLFGPTQAAARLESSKAFAKAFMERHAIPTARFEVAETSSGALAAVARFGSPVVVKADGLAAGKGVTVARDRATAEAAVHQAMEEGAFGEAGRRVIIEEGLEGPEVSVLALTDGETVLAFPPAQDHKRAFDGDRGPNTGGMGAYCPAAVLGPEEERLVGERILLPTVRGMAAAGTPVRGVLYAGIMLTKDGPRVLEFNCRFGDPETQVLLPLLEDDLAELVLAVARGELGAWAASRGRRPVGPGGLVVPRLRVSDRSAVCVVMASGGYPGRYQTGKAIEGLESVESVEAPRASTEAARASATEAVKVFHAATGMSGGQVVTAGGRVLNVVATAATLDEAVRAAYRAAGRLRFEGAFYRRDIAAAALRPQPARPGRPRGRGLAGPDSPSQ